MTKEKILVINTMCIGDVMLTTPALRVLKNNFPQSHITMLLDKSCQSIIENNSNVDEIIPLDKKAVDKSIFSLIKFIEKIRKRKLDLVVNLSCNERSAIITAFSGAKKKIGYVHRGKGLFLDGKVPFSIIPQGKRHMADAHLDVLATLGLTDLTNNGLEIFPNLEDQSFAEKFLTENGFQEDDILVGLNTGAKWLSKRWTKEGFAALADALQREYGVKVIIFGGPEDVERVEEIISLISQKPLVATGKTTLKQLAALIKHCKVFITNDSGPMHIAVGTKTPVIALYGPSPTGGFSPYGEGHTIIRKNLPCSPCNKHQCDHHQCMQEISVKEVLAAAAKYLRGKENV